jgi:hypothetical protein
MNKSDIEAIRSNYKKMNEAKAIIKKLRIHNFDELLDLEHAIKKQFDRWDDLYSDAIQKHYSDKAKKSVRLVS